MTDQPNNEIIENAYHLARGYEKNCTGCAQSAVAGLLEAFGIKNEDVFKAASGLADGIGLSGDGSCGALTGCAMVLGLFFGRDRKNHKDMMAPMKSYLLCRELCDDFIARYGSIRCYDIQTNIMGRSFNLLSPFDLKRAWKIKMIDYCSNLVGQSARKTAEIILREREKQALKAAKNGQPI
jgi:C_GCAxxG_C_C family probable redox protein